MTDLVTLLKTIGAPVLATVIGGPVGTLASAALGALADALGTDPTPDAVANKVAAGGEAAAVIVRQVEADKAPEYLDELKARLADVADARQQTLHLVDSGSSIAWAPVIVTAFVLALVIMVVAFVAYGKLPDNSLVVGWVLGTGSTAIAYWLGSSNGSRRNGDAIRGIAQQATTPTAGQAIGTVVDAALKPNKR